MRKLTAAEQAKVQQLALRGLKALRNAEDYRRYAARVNRQARESLIEAKALLAEVEGLTEGNE